MLSRSSLGRLLRSRELLFNERTRVYASASSLTSRTNLEGARPDASAPSGPALAKANTIE